MRSITRVVSRSVVVSRRRRWLGYSGQLAELRAILGRLDRSAVDAVQAHQRVELLPLVALVTLFGHADRTGHRVTAAQAVLADHVHRERRRRWGRPGSRRSGRTRSCPGRRGCRPPLDDVVLAQLGFVTAAAFAAGALTAAPAVPGTGGRDGHRARRRRCCCCCCYCRCCCGSGRRPDRRHRSRWTHGWAGCHGCRPGSRCGAVRRCRSGSGTGFRACRLVLRVRSARCSRAARRASAARRSRWSTHRRRRSRWSAHRRRGSRCGAPGAAVRGSVVGCRLGGRRSATVGRTVRATVAAVLGVPDGGDQLALAHTGGAP